MRWLSVLEAKAEVDRGTFLLCVSSEEQYRASHIGGSVLIPAFLVRYYADKNECYPAINRGRTPPRDRTVLIYCHGNQCDCPTLPSPSELAVRRLRQMGFEKLAVINGGLPAWRAVDLPVESADGEYAK